MEIRRLRPDEVQKYLFNYYSYLKVGNPEDFTAKKLKDYTAEDLQEVATLFTAAISEGRFIAGVCLYQSEFLQDGWPDDDLTGFSKIVDSLMAANQGLATYLNSFKPSDRIRVERLLTANRG